MRRPVNQLKSNYYADHREEILRKAKENYIYDGKSHYARHHQLIEKHKMLAIERRKQNRAFFIEKLGGRCVDCGYDKNPVALDFDHTDPKKKESHITSLMSLKDRERIWKEVQKCELRCAICHRIKTYEQKEHGRRPFRVQELN